MRIGIALFRLSVLAVVVLVSGCMHFTPPLTPPERADCCIYGNFIDHSLTRVMMGIFIKGIDTENEYVFRLDQGVVAYNIAPGKYRIARYVCTDQWGHGGNSWPYRKPKVLSYREPFVVESGRAYYIGDFYGHSWENYSGGYSFGYDIGIHPYNFSEHTKEFRKMYPNMADLVATPLFCVD